MDIIDAFKIWEAMGNTIESRYDEDDNYIVEFIKNGKIMGNIITYSSQGIKWNYPQEVMDYKQSRDC